MSIKLNDFVVNTEIYDSDDDDEEIPDIVSKHIEDEDTNELEEILSELLDEVADVNSIDKMKIKISFYDFKNINFVSKKTKCDFDYDDDNGYPVMADGGENYFLPYMEAVLDVNSDFRGLKIETNVKDKNAKNICFKV